MSRGFAAPQDIVVHGGHIIVHQRVSVNVFHRERKFVQIAFPRLRQPTGCVYKHGAHSFAAIQNSVSHRFGERSETAIARIQRHFGDTFEMPALFPRPNLKFGFVSFHHSNTSLLQSRRVARAVVLSFQFANASLGIFELSPAQIHQFGSARIGFHALFESKLALFHLADKSFEFSHRLFKSRCFLVCSLGHSRSGVVGEQFTRKRHRIHLRFFELSGEPLEKSQRLAT